MRLWSAALALPLLAACGSEPTAGAPPEPAAAEDGAFVRVEGIPIPYAEVQDTAKHYRAAFPAASANEVERLALTAYLIPRAAFEALAPEARAAALERARARLAELRGEAPAEPPPPGIRSRQADSAARIAPPIWRALEAQFAELGVAEPAGPRPVEAADLPEDFLPVLDAPWIGPCEGTGSFALVRLVAAVPGPPRGFEFEIEEFFFREHEGTRDDFYTRVFSTRLELVDPLARELVPRHWQLEMGAAH
jgi:hypothetical protein